MHRTTVLLLSALVATSATAGCGRDADERTQTSAGTIDSAMTIRVTDVQLGRRIGPDKRVTESTDTFAPNDTIYASVRTSGSGGNATVAAKWTFEDGTVIDERSEAIAPVGGAYTEFHITKATAWPAGKYTLVVTLNGKEVEREGFSVK